MMATHPSTPERIAAAEAEARRIGPPGEGATGRDAYLAAIDGLLFGDDPSQGVVRGTLVHPSQARLRLRGAERFHAREPVGRADRRRRRRRGGAAARQHSDLGFDPGRDAIASGWIDGVKTTDVETLQIGGLDAATATARGDQWSFRLGAVRLNGRLYRLIFAARSLTPAVDQRFRASLESFHLINARDSALAAPAGDQDRRRRRRRQAETMAARMAFLPQPLDQFLILNGLERGAPLVSGQRYKVVSQ